MASILDLDSQALEQNVMSRGVAAGFRLVHTETDTGQGIWRWERGDDPRPKFLTRRDAMYWMYDWLGRNGIYC